MSSFSYKETSINVDENVRYYESDYEEWSGTVKELYAAKRKEVGRCTGYVFIGTKEEEAVPVGWVFLKRKRYDERESFGRPMNKENSYLCETWVTVYDDMPRVIHPKEMRVTRRKV